MSMNLRQRENILYENIQLKKEKAEAEKKITDLMAMLETKMTSMVDILNQIKDKPSVVNHVNNSTPADKKEVMKESVKEAPIFIPTPDSSDLKMNVQDLKKKVGSSNLEDSLHKLSKLQEKP